MIHELVFPPTEAHYKEFNRSRAGVDGMMQMVLRTCQFKEGQEYQIEDSIVYQDDQGLMASC